MPQPLVAARWRRLALIAVAAGAGLVAVLGVLTYHVSGTSFDDWVLRTTVRHIGPSTGYHMLAFSRPATVVAVAAVVAVGAAAIRRWDVAVLAAGSPALAVVVTEQVLKPLLDRPLGSLHGSFPSGHETAVAATAMMLVVVAGQARMTVTARLAIVIVNAGWATLAAIGLVRNSYHYATDTIAALGVAVAVVLVAALGIDLVSGRVARSPARTARAT